MDSDGLRMRYTIFGNNRILHAFLCIPIHLVLFDISLAQPWHKQTNKQCSNDQVQHPFQDWGSSMEPARMRYCSLPSKCTLGQEFSLNLLKLHRFACHQTSTGVRIFQSLPKVVDTGEDFPFSIGDIHMLLHLVVQPWFICFSQVNNGVPTKRMPFFPT